MAKANHGWKVSAGVGIETTEQPYRISDGSEYRQGLILRPCVAGCGAWVPRSSFHHEECPKQD
jgi:hypothetical protein